MIEKITINFLFHDGVEREYIGMQAARHCSINFLIPLNKCKIYRIKQNVKMILYVKMNDHIVLKDILNEPDKEVIFSL